MILRWHALLIFLLITMPNGAIALKFEDQNDLIRIVTDLYELDWKKSESMGYSRIQLAGSNQSLIEGGDNPFYHGSDYAGGWRLWGALREVKVLEQTSDTLVLEYISQDNILFEYHCIATYQDGASYIRHEVYVENNFAEREPKPANDGAAWPVSGYDPMLIPGIPIEDMTTAEKPLPYVAYWTPEPSTFLGLYATDSKAKAKIGDWRGQGQQIQLDHDMFMKFVQQGQKGATLIYYIAFGEGAAEEAAAMAITIFNLAVEPQGKLPVVWGQLKHH